MDKAGVDRSLIRLVHGDRERVDSARYFFDNRVRGGTEACFVIQLTIRGRAFLELEGEVQEVARGDAMLYEHGEQSSYGFYPEDSEVYELEWIGFYGGPASELFAAARAKFGSVLRLPESSDARAEFARVLEVARSGGGDRFSRAALLYSLLLSLFRLPEQQGVESAPEERALEIMHNEFARQWNVKSIAGRLDCSREHLTRRFRERYGVSPARALRDIRLERACELLKATRLSVGEVAARCGMPDHNAFHGAFRKRYGVSPGNYRLLDTSI